MDWKLKTKITLMIMWVWIFHDGQYVFIQSPLIDVIINDVGIGLKQRKPVPISAHKLLHHHLDSPPHNLHHFNYRLIMRKLNYLTQISQPDIAMQYTSVQNI